MDQPRSHYDAARGGGKFDWREMMALAGSPAHQLVAHMSMGGLARAHGGMQLELQLACLLADEHCIARASSSSSAGSAASSACGGSPSACHSMEAALAVDDEAHGCNSSMGELFLQDSSMELAALLGERLEPPTESDLQQRALLQLLQPGAGAGAAHAPQLAASLTAGMPEVYLHKLEPHPLISMHDADEEAAAREDNGTDHGQQLQNNGQQRCQRQGQHMPAEQQEPDDVPAAHAARCKRARTLHPADGELVQPAAQAQQAQQQEQGTASGSDGSGSAGAHPQPSASGHAADTEAAATPVASTAGLRRLHGRENLTVELLEREGLLDMPADDAAHHLGIGKGSLKAAGLRLGIERWPFRTRSSARNFLLGLEEYCVQYMPREEVVAVLCCARARLAPYLNAITDTGLDRVLAALRQRCYKLLHRARQRDCSEQQMRKDVLRLAADIMKGPSAGSEAGGRQQVAKVGGSTPAAAVRGRRGRGAPSSSSGGSSTTSSAASSPVHRA